MKIYCCECGRNIEGRLTDGSEIYPHRPDLKFLPFWICDHCGNFVGCHHKTKKRTKPLGCIPNKEVRDARKKIHDLIDPVWKSGRIERRVMYNMISEALGKKYHTANIRSVTEANQVIIVAKLVISKISV